MSHWYEDHPGMTPADWGRLNYEAYLAARKPCDHSPEWKNLPENVREAWAVAAQAVRQPTNAIVEFVIDAYRRADLSEGKAVDLLSPMGLDRLAIRDLCYQRGGFIDKAGNPA